MLSGKPWDAWIAEYSRGHQHPVNRACHSIGIPLIAASIPLFLVLPFVWRLWPAPVVMFVIGWVFQFIGHWFERKPPEFFKDWRFLLVGLRWWVAKMRGRA